MLGEITKYYFFKKCLKKLPRELLNIFNYDDDLCFNVSTFTSTPIYYRLLNPIKKDRYKMYNKFKDESFNSFILECIYKIRLEDNPDKLFFLYGIIAGVILDKHLEPYIIGIKKDTETKDYIYNMIDYYYANKYDEINLSKTNIYKKFPGAFHYYEYMDLLIHDPLVRHYTLFSPHSYFKRSYARKKFFYRYLANNNFIYKGAYKTYDFIFRNKNDVKAIDYIYNKKIDTSILNLSKCPVNINGTIRNVGLDEIMAEAERDYLKKLEAINDFLMFEKDRGLKREFNLPNDVDMTK